MNNVAKVEAVPQPQGSRWARYGAIVGGVLAGFAPVLAFAQSSPSDLVNQATTTFSATTGFDLTAMLAWAVTNFYDLFLGSGLAVLYTLRGWIVAVIMIAAVLYFAYRLYQFFRH